MVSMIFLLKDCQSELAIIMIIMIQGIVKKI